MAEQENGAVKVGYGVYLSGVYTGATVNHYRATDERPARTVCKWGIADGTAESKTVYISEELFNALKLLPMSNVVLRVVPFPSGKDVGFRLVSIADGTMLYLEDGSGMTQSQVDALIRAVG